MLKLGEKALLTLMLALLVLGLLCASIQLSRPARLVPLSMLIPTLALLALQLLLDLAPHLARKWSRLFPEDVLGVQRIIRTATSGRETETRSRKSEEMVLMWLLTLLAFVLLVGLALALPLFTFVYLKWWARERWGLSLGMAAGIWVVLHGVFAQVLGARLYDGLLWGVL